MTGDTAECVISLELANDQFDAGAVVVEAPEVERLQRQIGDQDLVVVAAELEQRQLLGRLFGLWAAYDHEAIAAPPAGRLVAELGDLDAGARNGVAQVGEPALDGAGQARDDDETGLVSFEPFDQAVIVKPLVGADYKRSDTGGDLDEAGLEKVEDPGGSMGVAGPQLPVPEVTAVALEAEQRMVGGSPSLDGVVADARLLLFAVDHEHRGIHIEDDARGWLGKQGHPVQEAVMQSAQLRKRNRGNTQQEAPQRRSVGITWQASEVLKDADATTLRRFLLRVAPTALAKLRALHDRFLHRM